jgi:hypothetical protein
VSKTVNIAQCYAGVDGTGKGRHTVKLSESLQEGC